MNVELLRKIQAHILANPKELNMNVVAQNIEGAKLAKKFKPGAPCGTACCIDGFAQMFSGRIKPGLDYKGHETYFVIYDPHFAVGASILGLTPVQADRLFESPAETYSDYLDNYVKDSPGWPIKFAKAYVQAEDAGDYEKAAKVTYDRIEHFIHTQGEE